MKNKYFYVLFTVLTLFYSPTITAAENTGIGFQITPIYTVNQIDSDKQYFYLKTEPGENQKVEIKIFNTNEDKDITVVGEVENAATSYQGQLTYWPNTEYNSDNLRDPITEILKPQDKELVIPPQDSKIMTFNLNVPKKSYDGAKMGRIIVKEKVDTSKKGIKEVFQYGMSIVTSESGEAFNDGNNLLINKVKANILSGKKVVEAEIINPDPKSIENLRIESYITEKGNNKKLKTLDFENFSIAPNSKIKYRIPWGLSNFKNGQYTIHFKANNEYNKFNLVKNFVITNGDANKLNKEASFKVDVPLKLKLSIIAVNLLMILTGIYIFVRDNKWYNILQRRNKKRDKKNRRKKS